jgi:HSP20 family protein
MPRQKETMMPGLMRRDPASTEPDLFDRLDQVFDDWSRTLPHRLSERLRGPLSDDWASVRPISIDEYREGDDLVVRAELPGVNPDEDVQISLTDHHLHIEAHRHEEQETEKKGYVRRELRHGYFARDIPLPAAVTDADVEAAYADGILKVTVHLPSDAAPTRIPVERA